MLLKNVYNHLNKIYNFKNQAEWDASALIENNQDIDNILICLDINGEVIEFCKQNKIDLIISHHPLFVEPITPENFIAREHLGLLKKMHISAIFLHTPFDRSEFGMNHTFLKMLDVNNVRHSISSNEYVIGELPQSVTVHKFANHIKKTFKLDFVKYNKIHKNKLIKTIGFCSGSGSSMIYDLDEKLDVFITGDTKYHAWIDAEDLNIVIIDINHSIENMFIDIIAKHIAELSADLLINKFPSKLNFKII